MGQQGERQRREEQNKGIVLSPKKEKLFKASLHYPFVLSGFAIFVHTKTVKNDHFRAELHNNGCKIRSLAMNISLKRDLALLYFLRTS